MPRREHGGKHRHRTQRMWPRRVPRTLTLALVMMVVPVGIFVTLTDRNGEQTSSGADDQQSSPVSQPPPPPADRPPSLIPKTETVTEQPIEIPVSSDGTFDQADGESAHGHARRASELSYTVEVESGLPYDPAETATVIEAILDDKRGWATADGRALHRVAQPGDLRILLATPSTTDRLCAPLKTNGQVSCRNGDLVVLNARRWAFSTDDYDDVELYRTYLVNHEVGHALGYGHAQCPGTGQPAPVMQQQTYGLEGCQRNVWPTVA